MSIGHEDHKVTISLRVKFTKKLIANTVIVAKFDNPEVFYIIFCVLFSFIFQQDKSPIEVEYTVKGKEPQIKIEAPVDYTNEIRCVLFTVFSVCLVFSLIIAIVVVNNANIIAIIPSSFSNLLLRVGCGKK